MNPNLQEQLLKIVIDQTLESKLTPEARSALQKMVAGGCALFQAFKKQSGDSSEAGSGSGSGSESVDPAFDFRDVGAYREVSKNPEEPDVFDQTIRPSSKPKATNPPETKPVDQPANETKPTNPNWLLCLGALSNLLPANPFPCS